MKVFGNLKENTMASENYKSMFLFEAYELTRLALSVVREMLFLMRLKRITETSSVWSNTLETLERLKAGTESMIKSLKLFKAKMDEDQKHYEALREKHGP